MSVMPELTMLLPVLSLMIALLAGVGVVMAFMGNRGKGLSEVQNSTIMALQAQNEAQEKHIKILDRKIARLENTLSTLQITLKKRRGIIIEVNDEVITIIDPKSGIEQTVKIKIDSGELKSLDIEEE